MLPDRRLGRRPPGSIERAAAREPLGLGCVVGCASALLVSCAPQPGAAPQAASDAAGASAVAPSPNAVVAMPEPEPVTLESSPGAAMAPRVAAEQVDRAAGEPA